MNIANRYNQTNLNTIIICKVLNIYLALCNEISKWGKYSGFAPHFSLACDVGLPRQNNSSFMDKKETRLIF